MVESHIDSMMLRPNNRTTLLCYVLEFKVNICGVPNA